MKERVHQSVYCCVALVALFLRCLALCDDTQATSPVYKYTLEGTVINSVTAEPIRHALVEVPGQAGHAVLTDAEGRFHIEGIPEGVVVLSAEKPGFVGSGPFRTFNWNQVSAEVGSQNKTVSLRLTPESVISGRLIDGDGVPIEDATIGLVRIDIVEGRKQWLRLPTNTVSDSSGNFRFAGLCAGHYYVAVMAGTVRMPFESDRATTEGYPTLVYYPEGPISSPNRSLEVTAGQTVYLDLSLVRSKLFHISGAVVGKGIARQYGIQLLDPEGDILPASIHFAPNGKFEISRVPGGTYLIRSQTRDVAGRIVTMERNINVNSDIADLQIPLQQSVSIPVNVRAQFTAERTSCNTKADAQTNECSRSADLGVTVTLHSATPFQLDAHSRIEVSQGTPQPVVADVRPGEYVVSVRSSRGYAASVTSGGADLLREKLAIVAGGVIPTIDVVLRDDSASVAGNIHAAKPFLHAFVLLKPQFAPLQIPIVVKADSLGSFRQEGLAPGDYMLLAFDTLQDLEYTNPAIWDQYESRAGRITLTASQNAAVSVDLIVTPEE